MRGNIGIAGGLAHRCNGRGRCELPINYPEYWRRRAEEARALAEMIEDPEAKRMMMGVVEGYDRLAEYAEARQAAKESKPKKEACD